MDSTVTHRNQIINKLPEHNGKPRAAPKIGIALSGGGIRAAVFHLGVLSQLAGERLLEHVTAISTVSGGSLIAGLIFGLAGNGWPSSDFFLEECISAIRDRLTSRHSIQRDLISTIAWRPWQIHNRNANHLADSIRNCWGIHGELNKLTQRPRWYINATTYETGKNWRFVPHRSMGDYTVGYVKTPSIEIADAMAASAAVPGLIGPYVLDTSQYQWFNFVNSEQVPSGPYFEKLHLWDGSVYDFLGVEPLFKIGSYPQMDASPNDVDVLIVSDAAQPLHLASGESPVHQRAHRLVTIATDQVRSLRTRAMIDHFKQNPGSGAFLKIGTTVDKMFADWNLSPSMLEEVGRPNINRRDAEWASSMETTLRQITNNEFELLFQHGWEVAKYTLSNFEWAQASPIATLPQHRNKKLDISRGS